MTSNPLRLTCLAICLQATFAQAQDAGAASRVERDASNPMRMIIEASKLKPRQKAAEPEPAPAPKAAPVVVRAPAAKPAAPPVAASPTSAAPADRPPPLAQADAAEPARTADPASAEPEPPPVVAVEATPQAAPIDAPVPSSPAAATPAPEPALPPAPVAAATQVALAAPSPPQPEPAAAPAPAPAARASLQLAGYVEPVVPDRLRRRLQGEGVVVVKFTVNPDGSVADAAVRSSSDRALDAIALEAVAQWRYKPIAAAQPHAVELVFKSAN